MREMLEQAQGYVHTAKWHSFPVVFWLLISWSSNPVHVNFQQIYQLPPEWVLHVVLGIFNCSPHSQKVVWMQLPQAGSLLPCTVFGGTPASLYPLTPRCALCRTPGCAIPTHRWLERPFQRVSTQPLHNSRPFKLQKHTGQIFCRVTLWDSLSILFSVHMPGLPSEVSPCCCAPFCRGYTWEQVLLGV